MIDALTLLVLGFFTYRVEEALLIGTGWDSLVREPHATILADEGRYWSRRT